MSIINEPYFNIRAEAVESFSFSKYSVISREPE